MKKIDINKLFDQATEFEAVEFLKEVIDFVREIKPLLDDMNTSIVENVKKMPYATEKLVKVTEATEIATIEIMDVIDGITMKIANITNNLNGITDSELGGKNYEKVASSKELVEKISEDSMRIMIALQVQDITSQQIAAVNHLLSNIQTRLSNLQSMFESSKIASLLESGYSIHQKTGVTTMHRQIAFDPEAIQSYSSTESRQRKVDEIIGLMEEGIIDSILIPEEVSIPEAITVIQEKKIHDKDNIDLKKSVSKDDIDSIFSSPFKFPDDDNISQEDIDELFSLPLESIEKDKKITEK